jgi:hypothetical protein
MKFIRRIFCPLGHVREIDWWNISSWFCEECKKYYKLAEASKVEYGEK